MKMRLLGGLGLVTASLAAGAAPAAPSIASQAEAPNTQVRVERRLVHSQAIAGNLLGTSAEREVFVVLPPSYGRDIKRRYPVVYALHGFSIDAASWMQKLDAARRIAAAFAAGVPEVIVVFPDGSNEYGGSFYGSSTVTGDFETFIADELPAYIDREFRSIPEAAARGLMGHSMGGYGVARIGMKRPGRFGVLYMMSPCCLSALGTQGLTAKEVREINDLASPQAARGLPFKYAGPLATAAAFSPNPAKPPLFVDLPITEQGESREAIMAKRAANAPLSFIDQYVAALRTYRAIGIDVGDQDTIVTAATELHKNLDNYAISNQLDIYPGDHSSKVPERMQKEVLPFFGKNLKIVVDR
ncbi:MULTISPECIES: alpha/beta hydrolase [unclassified Sphingobium]|uniref:alpha/beta hydrolase n=1 Tax=unclassified Sphingobium TaxID=2611147 RepID=UPI00222451E5|nr:MULTISPECIES: alpha/beta fold hydrolase [unclassified Sphingobium]MCW2412700.1 enterochelin esterase-like enzyme [Sphingobium sp. B8D3D]MCW2415002.1 enterochelin esterase-like enzyme [Sphingobium sp. B8D3A]